MSSTASALLGALLVVAGVATAQEKVQLSIGTGGTGGVYYPLGGGIANLLSKNVPGMSATAEVTGGSVDNLKLIGSGKPYLGMTMADAGQDANRGDSPTCRLRLQARVHRVACVRAASRPGRLSRSKR